MIGNYFTRVNQQKSPRIGQACTTMTSQQTFKIQNNKFNINIYQTLNSDRYQNYDFPTLKYYRSDGGTG